MTNFGKLTIQAKSGNEKLAFGNRDMDVKLIDFWSWSVSDVESHVTRGHFEGFIVAPGLGIDQTIVRDEWRP